MENFSNILIKIDNFVWGPVMLILLVGTGIFLTIRTKALCWRNLPYALGSVMSREARQKKGAGDVSPFSALTTALAATIGTGNIVGVATAMVSGGPGALIWMWISAAFGLTSKFSECMLAIKYREINEKGEMSGGPMYTMKKAFRHKTVGRVLGWLFALFAVIASFGIGNLTQANSISSALDNTFHIPVQVTGVAITIFALLIIIGGIQSISRVSQVVVPLMALFYVIAGILIILGSISRVPAGIAMIFRMAFSMEAVGGGLCGSLTASMAQAVRFGVARGVFSNEAGMGSAAITAAAATTDDPVRQGYINMTGTFWDTIVVCTITGLCIASSGMLGMTETAAYGTYSFSAPGNITISSTADQKTTTATYDITYTGEESDRVHIQLTPLAGSPEGCKTLDLYSEKNSGSSNVPDSDPDMRTKKDSSRDSTTMDVSRLAKGKWEDSSHNEYHFHEDGSYEYREIVIGSALTIAAFQTVLGKPGGGLVCIGITLFAFSTILGWEYHGEKAFEYLFGTHRFNMAYRILFSLIVYLGATTTLEIAWNFSDIANALMAIPNLICLLALNGTIASELDRFQAVIKKEKRKNG